MSGLTIRSLKALSVASALVLASGCASTEQLEELRGQVSKAQADASAALAAANGAQTAADNARFMAEKAMDAARDAQACCDANSDKIDRMFQKSMQK